MDAETQELSAALLNCGIAGAAFVKADREHSRLMAEADEFDRYTDDFEKLGESQRKVSAAYAALCEAVDKWQSGFVDRNGATS